MGSDQKPKRRLAGALLVLLAGIALAAFTQQAAAAHLAGLVASLWVSAMSVIFRMVGALFGAH
jgi:hypothetical protein